MVRDPSDSVLKHAVSDHPKISGKRIFVFIIGGMTRSEVSTFMGKSSRLGQIMHASFRALFSGLKSIHRGLDLQLRVAHKLTPQLRREVVIGSTNIGDPHQFIRVSIASIMSCRFCSVGSPTCT